MLDEPGDGLVRIRIDGGEIEVADLAREVEIQRSAHSADVAPDLEAAIAPHHRGEDQLGLFIGLVAETGHGQVHLREILGKVGLRAAVDEAKRAFLETDLSDEGGVDHDRGAAGG